MAGPVKRPPGQILSQDPIAQELAMLCRFHMFHGWWQMVPANHPSIFLGCQLLRAPKNRCSQSQFHQDMSYIELPSGHLWNSLRTWSHGPVRNSWFTHKKWWVSMVFGCFWYVYQRVPWFSPLKIVVPFTHNMVDLSSSFFVTANIHQHSRDDAGLMGLGPEDPLFWSRIGPRNRRRNGKKPTSSYHDLDGL